MTRKIPVTASQAVERAYLIAKDKARYVLGAGGRNPAAPNPFTVRDGKLGSDCIGYVFWCWGLDRFQPDYPFYGGWINTDSLLMDVKKDETYFSECHPFVGCAVVYGSIWKKGKMVRMGHIGLVVDVPKDFPSNWKDLPLVERKAWMRKVKVLDCAAAASRRLLGKAVAARTAEIWALDGSFVRYKGQAL